MAWCLRQRFLTLSALGVLAACAADEHKDEPVVRSIHIEGAKQVSESDIKDKIVTESTSKLPFTKTRHFDQDVWKTDLRRIERYYRERGYYQAKVLGDEVKPDGKNGVNLKVSVQEGSPTKISSIALDTGDLPAKQKSGVVAKLPIKVGDIFLENDWEKVKDLLGSRLRELGYAAADVNGVAEVDLVTQKADLIIKVVPGARYHFGEVSVKPRAQARVEAWRIIELAKEDLKPTHWFSESAMADAQSRVYKMGVFGAVKIKPGKPDPQTGTVPIEVDPQEAPFHTIRAGFGIGVDQTRNEGRLIGEYTNRDFLGGLRRLELRATAGWAFLPNFYSPGAAGAKNGPVAKLTGELEQPRVFHPDLKLQTRLELERGIEPAYNYIGGRSKIGLVWQPTAHLSIFPSYNLEAYRLQQGIAGLGGNAPSLLFGCQRVCVLSYLEQQIQWDRRNDAQEPTKGYLLAFSVQEGGGPLGGSFGYVRIQPEARGYFSLGREDRFTLAARLRLGSLRPGSRNDLDSPIVARFFSGGNGMRGFNNQRLSPMYIVPVANDSFTGVAVPIGGNGLIEASLEARYRLTGPLVLAAFLDTGTVTTERINLLAPGNALKKMMYAVGAGIRYRTPVGPIRLDFAYRPNIGPPLQIYQPPGADLTYESPTGCFGIGGRNGTRAGSPEGPCTIQISIGEAF